MSFSKPRDIGCGVSECDMAGTIKCDFCPSNPVKHNVKPITLKDFTTDELLAEIRFRITGVKIN